VVSDDAGLTWASKQNLTVGNPFSVHQGGVGWINSFGAFNGVTILGAATHYVMDFNAATTRGAMWRSVDLGDVWSLIDSVGGGLVTTSVTTAITAFPARSGRGVIDQWNVGTTERKTWYNPSTLVPGTPAVPEVPGVPAPVFKLRCEWKDAAFPQTTIVGTLRPRGNI
jgi:hypothetical protein